MANTGRFECVSSALRPKHLLKRTEHVFWVCLGIGAAAHLSLARISGPQTEQKVVKPLTTQFVKRQPRLTKPLELKKRPQPKRRQPRREMVAVKARLERTGSAAGFEPAQALAGLSRPVAAIGRVAHFASAATEPSAIAGSIEGIKENEESIDLSLELLDIESLDTGKYHAMVIQDPADKRSLKGFCRLSWLHIPRLHDRTLSYGTGEATGWANYELGGCVRNLAEAMNLYTSIRTDVAQKAAIDNLEASRLPWIFHYYSQYAYGLSDAELQTVGRYLMQGGFLFADTHPIFAYDVSSSHRENLIYALETQGIRTDFQILPGSHPMYHCYFDFSVPPAATDGYAVAKGYPAGLTAYLEGLEVDGRLVAILSKKGYLGPWFYWGPGNEYDYMDPTRQFQFGINTIVFALTQEGSITHRLMESVK